MNKAENLRKLIASKKVVKVMGAHNGLGAKLIERAGFDAAWASGLEISTSHAVPDANILTMTDNLQAAQEINDATKIPVICDCDTGYGNASNVKYMIKKYEAAGIAAVVIEDKLFPKVNSFIPGRQELASIDEFVGKLQAANSAKLNPNFMVFARIEALIAEWGMHETLQRAKAYAEAGADGLVIHSKSKTPDQIYTFMQEWKGNIPVIAIPTTYYQASAEDLAEHGIKIVIYANHGLRAAYRAMRETFETIAKTNSTVAVEDKIAPLKDIFEIQGMLDIKEDDQKFITKERIYAIIPAAKDHRTQPQLNELLQDKPLCMVDVAGTSLIDRQISLLRSSGVSDIGIVGGFCHEKIKSDFANVLFNADYEKHHSAHSIMYASDYLKRKTLIVYCDILFDQQILTHLLDSPYAITLVIDRAYQTLPQRNKQLDLVISPPKKKESDIRSLNSALYRRISKVGKEIDKKKANFEFIGMAFLREDGSKALIKAWQEANEVFKDKPFYESSNVLQASFTDLLQYVIDRGYPVHGMEIEHGWSEIHSREDLKRVNAYLSESL